MFRSYDHPQGAHIVPCQSYNLKHLANYAVRTTRRTTITRLILNSVRLTHTHTHTHTQTQHAATVPKLT